MTSERTDSDPSVEEFLRIAVNYFHPEIYLDSIDELKEIVSLPSRKQSQKFINFKIKLREFLEHGTAPVADELSSRVQFEDGSAPMFCRRAWVELWPNEPIPGPVPGPFHALLTVLHCYYSADEYGNIEDLKSQAGLPEGMQGAYTRQLKDDLARVLRGDLSEHTARLIRSVGTRASGGEYSENKIARAVWHQLYPWDPIPDDALPEGTPPIGVRRPEDA